MLHSILLVELPESYSLSSSKYVTERFLVYMHFYVINHLMIITEVLGDESVGFYIGLNETTADLSILADTVIKDLISRYPKLDDCILGLKTTPLGCQDQLSSEIRKLCPHLWTHVYTRFIQELLVISDENAISLELHQLATCLVHLSVIRSELLIPMKADDFKGFHKNIFSMLLAGLVLTTSRSPEGTATEIL